MIGERIRDSLFQRVGTFDALLYAVCTVHFGDFAQMTEKEMWIGLKDKLMGQVNLVLIGRDHINDGGSFTLISGVLSHDPIRYGAAASLVNGAIDAYVRAPLLSCRGDRGSIPSVLDCWTKPLLFSTVSFRGRAWRSVSVGTRLRRTRAWQGPMSSLSKEG